LKFLKVFQNLKTYGFVKPTSTALLWTASTWNYRPADHAMTRYPTTKIIFSAKQWLLLSTNTAQTIWAPYVFTVRLGRGFRSGDGSVGPICGILPGGTFEVPF